MKFWLIKRVWERICLVAFITHHALFVGLRVLSRLMCFTCIYLLAGHCMWICLPACHSTRICLPSCDCTWISPSHWTCLSACIYCTWNNRQCVIVCEFVCMHAIVREFSTYMSLAIMPSYIVREFNIFACMSCYVNLPARMTLYVRLFVFLHSIARVSVCLHVIVREFAYLHVIILCALVCLLVNVREFVCLHVLSVCINCKFVYLRVLSWNLPARRLG